MSKPSITAICYDKRGRILSIGKNSYVKTHPLQAKYAKITGETQKIYLHAEIAAIVRCRDPSKVEKIRVIRLNKYGQPMNARPCKICEQAIKELGWQVEHT